MAIYRINKPHKTSYEWFKIIGFRVLFPPILLLDSLRFLVNTVFGRLVGIPVLPAQILGFDKRINNIPETEDDSSVNDVTLLTRIVQWIKIIGLRIIFFPILFGDLINAISEKIIEKLVTPRLPNLMKSPVDVRDDGVNLSKHTIVTYDNCELDTLEINCSDEKNISLNEGDKTYIINFVGNGMCYEMIAQEMVDDAKALACNVIGFNQRGVGRSTGRAWSKGNLVTDGIAQVQRLIDQGVNPEHIFLKGHSLGSGIATLVARHFHAHGQKVNLFNGRSFSNLTNVVTGKFRKMNRVFAYIAKEFIKIVLFLSKWEIEAADAYQGLPDTHKEYMVVRDDPVITPFGSLHAALRSVSRTQKNKIDQALKQYTQQDPLEDGMSDDSSKQKMDELQKARDLFKVRKMNVSEYYNGHTVGMFYLVSQFDNRSKPGYNANGFFRDFVTTAIVDHDQVSAESSGPKQAKA